MKTETKKTVGRLLLIVIFAIMIFLIFGYADIACSIVPDNILHTNYEPSGLQMLYFVFVIPVFVILSLLIWLIKKYMVLESPKTALLPISICLFFYILLEFIDSVITFPAGNNLFYLGSLTLAFLFFLANIGLATLQVRSLVRKI